MHELLATENILKLALQQAEAAGAPRITDVRLVVGQLSSMSEDSVQFYWETLARDTPAEGSRLHFRRIPAEMLCLNCGQRYAPAKEEWACPKCGSLSARVVAGQEFYLEAIDVEPQPV